jgi:hypothetical protein
LMNNSTSISSNIFFTILSCHQLSLEVDLWDFSLILPPLHSWVPCNHR